MLTAKRLLALLFLLTVISCNQRENSTTEKENELLKKENELLKKEQQLNDKEKETAKPQSTTNTTSQTTNSSDNWQTFNHRHGFTIQLPNYFSVGAMTASGIQYYKTEVSDQIMLGIETFGGSQQELLKDYTMRQNSSTGIDYKVLKENWFVVSGQNSEGIYYFKEIVKGKWIHSLLLQYPTDQKDLMDNILPRVSKSFQ